jgi:CRISPR/Cas system-associated exonuclease Cas4 (RecB family)
MAEELNWQPIASKDMDREQPPHLRISSAGRCVRAQTYAASGKPESNLPGNQARNRMAMGHMAEILILKEMERNGWETKHTVLSDEGQLELELEIPGAGATIKGHPDGIGRHPGFTKGQWVTLECKSMSMDRALDVEESGVAAVYPAYVAQISLYSRKLHEMGLVSHPERGIFAMMDRDGRMIPPERIAWEREDVDETLEKLAEIVRSARAGELPDRPYPQSSTECKYCNYHSTCWGTDPEPGEEITGKATTASDNPEVVEAAQTWAELKPRVDQARDILQTASNSAGGADVMVKGIIGGYFQPRSERVYDPDALERAVPADILKKCLADRREKLPAFWVRKANR